MHTFVTALVLSWVSLLPDITITAWSAVSRSDRHVAFDGTAQRQPVDRGLRVGLVWRDPRFVEPEPEVGSADDQPGVVDIDPAGWPDAELDLGLDPSEVMGGSSAPVYSPRETPVGEVQPAADVVAGWRLGPCSTAEACRTRAATNEQRTIDLDEARTRRAVFAQEMSR